MEPRRRQIRRARPADPDLSGATARAGVLAANDAFYRAMREGDCAAMEKLWAQGRTVTCTHPDWKTLVGLHAVMESWRLVLLDQIPPLIWPEAASAVVTGSTALVLCAERVEGAELIATNSFVREAGEWRLLNHQSAYVGAARAE